MNSEENDYSSDEDEEEDDDYCPEKDVVENVSEEESDGDAEDPVEQTKLSGKRGLIEDDNKQDDTELVDTECDAEKKRADSLWADFLSDTGTTSNKKPEAAAVKTAVVSEQKCKESVQEPPAKTPKLDIEAMLSQKTETSPEKKEEDESIPQSTSQTNKFPIGLSKKKRSFGGIGSVLSQIGKKDKINTLEKTKLDWDTFKQSQGITEDLQTFNKGRDGYLERQDFLQRTDVRQFEIERSLRQTKRTNR